MQVDAVPVHSVQGKLQLMHDTWAGYVPDGQDDVHVLLAIT